MPRVSKQSSAQRGWRELTSALGTKCDNLTCELTARLAKRLGSDGRLALVSVCDRLLADVEIRKDPLIRSAISEALDASYPESWYVISKWLSRRDEPFVDEVQASLFCSITDRTPRTLKRLQGSRSYDWVEERLWHMLCTHLNCSVEESTRSDLCKQAKALDYAGRKNLMPICDQLLEKVEVRRSSCLVLISELLYAVLPESKTVIRKWLERDSRNVVGEVHFSLFCSLTGISEDPDLAGLAPEVAQWAKSNLMRLSTDPGQGGWMAADLLGCHFPESLGVPALLYTLSQGRHVMGRRCALSGLEGALDRDDTSAAVKEEIRDAIRHCKKHDRSRFMRHRARFVLRNARESLLD